MDRQPTTEQLLWTYTLRPNVRDRIGNLLSCRCGTTLDHRLHKNSVHLTTLLRAIHYIWHTVWDDAPIEPSDCEMLRIQERKLRCDGDAIVRGVLEDGRLLGKGDIMYVLVRNIRTKVRMKGLDGGEWVLFNVTHNQHRVQFMFQRAGAGEHAVLVEDIPWRRVVQYLASLRFQLDHKESGQFGTIEEQLGLEPLEQSYNPRFLKVGHPDILRSLREI